VDDYYSGQEDISVEGLIEEQRRLALSKTFFEKVVGTLCVAALLKKRLAALTDAAIGQLMVDHVCNEMNVFSPELTICEVATERLIHPSPVLVKSDKENLHR
jgi:hypothetical protein